jgi:ArsR family transcriptional regulator, arsenate/arsenite/antimonite-responsive transcriptional repressor
MIGSRPGSRTRTAEGWPGLSNGLTWNVPLAYTGKYMPPDIAHPATPGSALRVKAAIDERLDRQLFKALSDPTRLLVLSCLIKCGRPCSVTEIAECCDVEFSVVNKHLKVLATAGVLFAEKEGRTVWYAARCGDLCERFARLIDAIAEWCPNLAQLGGTAAGTPCCASSRGGCA